MKKLKTVINMKHYKTVILLMLIHISKNSYKFLNTYENFSFKNLYVPGVYYGIFPSIINNLKIEDYMITKKSIKDKIILT